MGIRHWVRKLTRRESIEDIERDIRLHKMAAKAYREGLRSAKNSSAVRSRSRVVSTKTVVCCETGEKHSAILLVHEDGTIEVKCPGECALCDYERLL